MPDVITVFLNKDDDDNVSVAIYLLWNRPGELLYYMGYMAMCRGFHSGQTTGHSREHARGLCTSGHFPSSSHKIFTVNLRHLSHLGTKLNHSAPPNVLFLSFTA